MGVLKGEILKVWIVMVFLFGSLLAFQNCGESVRNTGLLAQDSSILQQSNCEETNTCTQPAEYLWLQIREYEPYKIQISTVQTHFNVGGRCGVGSFSNHSFLWELREGFGDQAVVGQGFEDNRCLNGQFIVPIINNQLALVPNQRYTLTMELVGVTEANTEVSNPNPSNVATLDILFTTEPPK